jgi:CRISPR-associated protein Cas1
MPVVYVKEQGASVHKRGGRMVVEKDGAVLAEVPLRETELVAVFGSVQVTTQAMSELLDRGIPLALYTRHGRLKGRLEPEMSKNVPLRLAQYRAGTEESASLALARPMVTAKLANSAAVIEGYRANYPSEGLGGAGETLRREEEAAAKSATHDELMGHEGAGAAAYFGAFAEMNRSGLPFPGRRKHPATDPLNALLSLGYTMAMNELRGMAAGLGLEPYIGFLHRPDYGRPSLPLDLLEPFRAPLVDRLALRLVNERILTAGDFAQRAGGPMAGSCVLAPEAWKRYLEEYESAMDLRRAGCEGGFREAMRGEVQSLAGALTGRGEFRPYREKEAVCST